MDNDLTQFSISNASITILVSEKTKDGCRESRLKEEGRKEISGAWENLWRWALYARKKLSFSISLCKLFKVAFMPKFRTLPRLPVEKNWRKEWSCWWRRKFLLQRFHSLSCSHFSSRVVECWRFHSMRAVLLSHLERKYSQFSYLHLEFCIGRWKYAVKFSFCYFKVAIAKIYKMENFLS